MKKIKILILSLFLLFSWLFVNTSFWYTSEELTGALNLAEFWIIVDQSSDFSKFELDQNVLRQEIAWVANSLSCIPKKWICENKFADVSANKPNSWACFSIEALLDKWLIAENKNFRPEDNISKSEALGMVVKALYWDEYAYNQSLKTSWQEQVVAFWTKKWIVNNFTDYDKLATRGFIFDIANKAIKKSWAKCNLWNEVKKDDNKDSNKDKDDNKNKDDDFEDVWISVWDITRVACSSATVEEYSVPALREWESITVEKHQEIIYWSRIDKQKFVCKDWKIEKDWVEQNWIAKCKDWVNHYPWDSSRCYVKPPSGWGSSSAPIAWVCWSLNNSSATALDLIISTPGLCSEGTPSAIKLEGHVWTWNCNWVNGWENKLWCTVPEAYCAKTEIDSYKLTDLRYWKTDIFTKTWAVIENWKQTLNQKFVCENWTFKKEWEEIKNHTCDTWYQWNDTELKCKELPKKNCDAATVEWYPLIAKAHTEKQTSTKTNTWVTIENWKEILKQDFVCTDWKFERDWVETSELNCNEWFEKNPEATACIAKIYAVCPATTVDWYVLEEKNHNEIYEASKAWDIVTNWTQTKKQSFKCNDWTFEKDWTEKLELTCEAWFSPSEDKTVCNIVYAACPATTIDWYTIVAKEHNEIYEASKAWNIVTNWTQTKEQNFKCNNWTFEKDWTEKLELTCETWFAPSEDKTVCNVVYAACPATTDDWYDLSAKEHNETYTGSKVKDDSLINKIIKTEQVYKCNNWTFEKDWVAKDVFECKDWFSGDDCNNTTTPKAFFSLWVNWVKHFPDFERWVVALTDGTTKMLVEDKNLWSNVAWT